MEYHGPRARRKHGEEIREREAERARREAEEERVRLGIANRQPAGWYQDPDDPLTNRYWDGAGWTDNRAARFKEQRVTSIIVVGYICAVVLPVVGVIIGATQIDENRHGVWIVVLSVAALVLLLGSGSYARWW